jgi:hypothetical protein
MAWIIQKPIEGESNYVQDVVNDVVNFTPYMNDAMEFERKEQANAFKVLHNLKAHTIPI